jgi:hypothetical protein
MKIVCNYEIGDKILFKAPTGPLKFREFVGVITDIVLHFDEESDTSNMVLVVDVNSNSYTISYPQILSIAVDDDHAHFYVSICQTCGERLG